MYFVALVRKIFKSSSLQLWSSAIAHLQLRLCNLFLQLLYVQQLVSDCVCCF